MVDDYFANFLNSSFSNAHKSLRVKLIAISLLLFVPFQGLVIIKIDDLLLYCTLNLSKS